MGSNQRGNKRWLTVQQSEGPPVTPTCSTHVSSGIISTKRDGKDERRRSKGHRLARLCGSLLLDVVGREDGAQVDPLALALQPLHDRRTHPRQRLGVLARTALGRGRRVKAGRAGMGREGGRPDGSVE